MSQIKYLVYAFLLLLHLSLLTIGITKLSSIALISKPPDSVPVDFVEPSKSSVNIYGDGKAIFSANCQTCHALDRQLTGPVLRGVNERGPWTDRKNLIKWVHNPGGFIPTTEYTKNLAATFGQIMPSFPQLADKEINAIFDYIKTAGVYSSMPVAIQ